MPLIIALFVIAAAVLVWAVYRYRIESRPVPETVVNPEDSAYADGIVATELDEFLAYADALVEQIERDRIEKANR